jgi:hypothetical protein
MSTVYYEDKLMTVYILQNTYNTHILKTSKPIPIHAWTGPDGSRRMRLPDIKTVGIRR